MAQVEHKGHADHSAAKLAAQIQGAEAPAPASTYAVAPADMPGYDPSAYGDAPGAAARAAGYPRSDGGRSSTVSGSARNSW